MTRNRRLILCPAIILVPLMIAVVLILFFQNRGPLFISCPEEKPYAPTTEQKEDITPANPSPDELRLKELGEKYGGNFAGNGIPSSPSITNPNVPNHDPNTGKEYILEVSNGGAKCKLLGPSWYEQHSQKLLISGVVLVIVGFAAQLWRINRNIKRLKT